MASDQIAPGLSQSGPESLQGQRLLSLFGWAVHCLTVLMENVYRVGMEKKVEQPVQESFYMASKVASQETRSAVQEQTITSWNSSSWANLLFLFSPFLLSSQWEGTDVEVRPLRAVCLFQRDGNSSASSLRRCHSASGYQVRCSLPAPACLFCPKWSWHCGSWLQESPGWIFFTATAFLCDTFHLHYKTF